MVSHRGVAVVGIGSRIGRFLASPIAGEYFGPRGVILRGVVCQVVVGVSVSVVIMIVNVTSGVGGANGSGTTPSDLNKN